MEFRDAVKRLRGELGLTQVELANALHVNYATVGRWERGLNIPNRTVTTLLMEVAKAKKATVECIDTLSKSITEAAREKLNLTPDNLYSVEHTSLSQLIDDASFPIYVCDLQTNDLYYINRKAQELLGGTLEQLASKKCYACFMHSSVPCTFCRKEQLKESEFTFFDAFLPQDNTLHQVQAKLIRWNGRPAQVRYLIDFAGSVSVNLQRQREIAYNEQLRIRQESAENSVAMAHFNLTHNKICAGVSQNENFRRHLLSSSVDELFALVVDNPVTPDNRAELESVFNRETLIKQYYMGRTHFQIKHFARSLTGYYESTFDIVQNPVTYDIEAVVVMRDITGATIIEEVAQRLFSIDYETIATIDAISGETRPYIGHHIDGVIKEQKTRGNNSAGVEAYLHKYCADGDVDRIIRETSLSNIKEMLETKPSFSVSYSHSENGAIIRERVVFAYLDKTKTLILCAVQNMTDIYKQLKALDCVTDDAVLPDRGTNNVR